MCQWYVTYIHSFNLINIYLLIWYNRIIYKIYKCSSIIQNILFLTITSPKNTKYVISCYSSNASILMITINHILRISQMRCHIQWILTTGNNNELFTKGNQTIYTTPMQLSKIILVRRRWRRKIWSYFYLISCWLSKIVTHPWYK